MRAVPDESKTRQSHFDRPRLLMTTSSIMDRSALGQIGSIVGAIPRKKNCVCPVIDGRFEIKSP
jgi:hypothetical protein